MKEFLKRNRKVLLISLTIFIIFAVAGAIYGFISIGDNYGMISQSIYQMKANGTLTLNETVTGLNTFDVFLHNLFADLIVIAGGLLFSVISVIAVILNAVGIGAPFGMDFNYFAVTILPHGIIEYAATVISLACAFNITKIVIAIIRQRSFRNVLGESDRQLKDILIMIAVVVVLLAVAAVIEANLVDPIARMYFGF